MSGVSATLYVYLSTSTYSYTETKFLQQNLLNSLEVCMAIMVRDLLTIILTIFVTSDHHTDTAIRISVDGPMVSRGQSST